MSRSPLSGRERLDAAGESLARLRQEAGLPTHLESDTAGAGRRAAASALEAALEAARARLKELSAELLAERGRAEECEEENRRLQAELEARPGEEALEAARELAKQEVVKQRGDQELRAKILVERLTLQQAEMVRLESLRRKAELAVSDGEKSRRSVEEALRRELRQAHGALDSAAAAAGAREGQFRADLESMHARLDAAAQRLQDVEKERRRLADRSKEELKILGVQSGVRDLASELVSERQRADESIAAANALSAELDVLRRERIDLTMRAQVLDERLTQQHSELARLEVLRREAVALAAARDTQLRAELEAQAQEARARDATPLGAELSAIHARLAAEKTRARKAEELAAVEILRLRAELKSAVESAALKVERESTFPEVPGADGFISPSLEPTLEAGWARLLRLVRPPVEAAYAHLRRLSALPLASGPRALVRLSAVSLSQAEEALTVIDLVLNDAPASLSPSSVAATLEQSLSAWEPALRRQGVVMLRDISRSLPDAAHEPRALRAVIYQIMRNALEALPRGARLSVKAGRDPDGGLRLEFSDDGPGFPAAWLERRFEPFTAARRGHAGLGLALARRTLRRWGGTAEAGNGPGERGARLTLHFAPVLPEGPEPVTLQA